MYLLLAAAAGAYAVARRPLPPWFWTASRAGALIIVIQGVLGVLLFATGARPGRALHLLYGLLSITAAFVLAGLREGGWVRRLVAADTGSGAARTAALIAFTQAALLLRTWMTGIASGR